MRLADWFVDPRDSIVLEWNGQIDSEAIDAMRRDRIEELEMTISMAIQKMKDRPILDLWGIMWGHFFEIKLTELANARDDGEIRRIYSIHADSKDPDWEEKE